MQTLTLEIGGVNVGPRVQGDELISLGEPTLGHVAWRSASVRWLPWIDSFRGEVFRRFRLEDIQARDDGADLSLRALSDPDALFQERLDSSGDTCLREESWDAQPADAAVTVHYRPASAQFGGLRFEGFTYWFDYESRDIPIHRLADRQSWEPGGSLDGQTILLRNWLTPPRVRLGRDVAYSTAGGERWSALMPGNLWARWSLLPSFDIQYGQSGVLLAWFDRLSLIRSVLQTRTGEDTLRVVDLHFDAQSTHFLTNAKTVLYCPERLSDLDALNLWTEVHDTEKRKARVAIGLTPDESPSPVVFVSNRWNGIDFATSYSADLQAVAELGGEHLFIDSIWEHGQAYRQTLAALLPTDAARGTVLEKVRPWNMCVTHDFEVAQALGGEEGLRQLCEHAAALGLGVLSWMALHMSPLTYLTDQKELGLGAAGIFAAKASGRHPDTGYPDACWPLNLHAPIADRVLNQLLGVCCRTGLSGYLWDSFSNLGWWQLDFSTGTLAPQVDRLTWFYRRLIEAGLQVLPEGLVAFTDRSMCGMHGGDIYAGDLLPFSYATQIALWDPTLANDAEQVEYRILRGDLPIDPLFRALAHRRVPLLHAHRLPRDCWDAGAVQRFRSALQTYRAVRHRMRARLVLPDDAGVLWHDGTNRSLLWSFRDQPTDRRARSLNGTVVDRLQANRVYEVDADYWTTQHKSTT